MRSHNKTLFSKVSKILAEFNKVFNFESLSFIFCKNLIETLHAPCCCLYFLKENLTQNVYYGKFSKCIS